MSRPISKRRILGDNLLIAELANGPRLAGDVIKAFNAAGLDKDDYRLSRMRLGAKVRTRGKAGPKARFHWVYFDGPVPVVRHQRRGSKVRVRIRTVREQCSDEVVMRMRADLAKKLKEVDEFMGRLRMEYRKKWDHRLVPVAGFDGSLEEGVGYAEYGER